jgi:hypothetical protein
MPPFNFSNINSVIGKELQNSVTGSLLGGFSSYLQFKDVQNSKLNSTQKAMGKMDAGVQGVASAASLIPGVGHAVGLGLNLLNTVGGALIKQPEMTKNYQSNQDVMSSGAFSGTANEASEVENSINSFGTAGLFGKLAGKKKMLNQTMSAQKNQLKASNVINESKKALSNIGSASMFDTRTNMNQSGFSFDNLRMGKEGLKIEARKIFKKFEKGGSIEKNVILNGVLHARKHSLKEIDKFADAEITHKGIPVITEMKDGSIIQHAEVEADELVIHYDLTKKLEELMEIGTEEAMIEAGKILSKELIKNTKDSKSKLLKQL